MQDKKDYEAANNVINCSTTGLEFYVYYTF